MAELHRLRARRAAAATLEDLRRAAKTTFVIHYSCESYYDIDNGRTPRITSIAIRNLSTAQTNSFSIHKVAEQHGFSLDDIPRHYDELEKEMLGEYFEFLRKHPGFKYIHWNMRDISYGFPAVEHRYKVLGGEPYYVPDDDKFDLARAMVALYSRSYTGHGKSGRFLNISKFNNITDKDALTGAEEADAFKNQQYVKLHASTLRKSDMMSNVFERACDGTLKTEANWREIYGFNPAAAINLIKEHWAYSLIAMIATISGIIAKFAGLF